MKHEKFDALKTEMRTLMLLFASFSTEDRLGADGKEVHGKIIDVYEKLNEVSDKTGDLILADEFIKAFNS